eukprot:UC1_evm1s1065
MLRVYDWRHNDGTVERQFKAHAAPVVAMDFDSTSTLLATGSADATVKVWDVIKGFCTHNFRGHRGVVGVVRFHPSVLRLVSSADDCQLRLWDLESSRCVAQADDHYSTVRGICFEANGRRLLTAGRDKVLHTWDADSLALEDTLPIFEAAEALVVLSPEALLQTQVAAVAAAEMVAAEGSA